MTGRSLHAFINQIAVGTLLEINGLWRFKYAQTWMEDRRRCS